MAKKKNVTTPAPTETAPEAATPVTTLPDAATAPETSPSATTAKPKGKKRRAESPPVATLELAALGYLGWMESQGKSRGTVASYSAELALAQSELGAETQLADLTPEQVATYFDCARVTRLRSGKPKSQLSIDKTRRVLRLCLVWATNAGWINAAPLPTKTAAQVEAPTTPAATSRPRRTGGVTVVVGDRVVLDGAAPENAA